MNTIIKRLLPVADLLLVPFVYLAALLLRNVRKAGIRRLPNCKAALLSVGVFPIRNHYYEPLFDPSQKQAGFATQRLWTDDSAGFGVFLAAP